MGKLPFRRTLFDLPMGIFLITAAVGVWAAYDREAAWAKFWLLVAGILLYYALASQPRENLKIVAGFMSALAGGIALFFLLTYNWQNQPADFDVLNRLGIWWMAVRPQINIQSPSPNFMGGISAMLLPYPFFMGLKAIRERDLLAVVFFGLVGGLAFIGLLMTSSRAAWGALSIALGIYILWVLAGWVVQSSSILEKGKVFNRRQLFTYMLLLLGGLVIVLFLSSPSGVEAQFNSLPGLRDGESRLNLYKNSLPLFRDFFFTGGGLNAFAGLYSRYVLVIPQFFFGYSHNLLLDIAIEQGIFGILAFGAIFLGSIWLLIADKNFQSHHWAVLASLVVIGLHGLLDDALYGERGTPFLFLSLGLVLAVAHPQIPDLKISPASFTLENKGWYRRGLAVVGSAICIAFIFWGKSLLAGWYADLGSVQMARVELVGFPSEQLDGEDRVAKLAEAERLFDKAIKISQTNCTAHYRLGLISLLHRDFSTASNNLAIAFSENPENRGIQKNLGYCYIWTKDFSSAVNLLADVPEAISELDTYSWWWGTQGRDDLASYASQAATMLKFDY